MRIPFDHGAPAPLVPFLEGHAVTKVKDAGWDKPVNGELLNLNGLLAIRADDERGLALFQKRVEPDTIEKGQKGAGLRFTIFAGELGRDYPRNATHAVC